MTTTQPKADDATTATRAPALEVIDLHKQYRPVGPPALDGLTLRVEHGELVAITGPSGSGKSTLLALIAALERPTSGRVRVDGNDVTDMHRLARFRRESVGLVFQLHALIPQLTAAQNVEVAMFGAHRRARERASRARTLLAEVGLACCEDRPPTELSGGERQRVAIARALANEPALLLADEPTGNLDAAAAELVLALFADLRQRRSDLTIIVVTHDPRVLARADRVVTIVGGRVVSDERSSSAS